MFNQTPLKKKAPPEPKTKQEARKGQRGRQEEQNHKHFGRNRKPFGRNHKPFGQNTKAFWAKTQAFWANRIAFQATQEGENPGEQEDEQSQGEKTLTFQILFIVVAFSHCSFGKWFSNISIKDQLTFFSLFSFFFNFSVFL